MQITACAFDEQRDRSRLAEFIMLTNQLDPETGYVHLGDVLWQLYQNTVFDPSLHVRLWEDEHGSLLGFAWHEDPDGIVFQVAPQLRGSGDIEREMLDWGAAQVNTASPGYDGHLWTRVSENNPTTLATITASGFERDEGHALKLRYPLNHEIAPPQIPPGCTVRAVGDVDEWPA